MQFRTLLRYGGHFSRVKTSGLLEPKVRALFSASEQGTWFDPSDLSTLFSDSAGTTAAVVDGPVGKMLDKSGRGNHATQATAGSRPTLKVDANGYYYLKPDGTDDWMSTAAIDFSANDKLTVWTAIRKLVDTPTYGCVVELKQVAAGNPGSFGLFAPGSTTAGVYHHNLSGSLAPCALDSAGFVAPVTNVITVQYDLAGAAVTDEIKPRVNGVIPTLNTITAGPAGGGNFRNDILYMFRRTGTTLPFSGHFYGGVILGRTATAAEIGTVERYLANKAGVAL